MKKIVRLTESDLVLLVNRIIMEQSSPKKIDYTILQTFLNGINTGGNNYFQNWVLDLNNTNKKGQSLKLTGNEKITILPSYFGKPLVWSLIRNGKKEIDSVFEIFNTDNGLYYQCQSNKFNRCLSGLCSNTEPYEKLTPSTVNQAINKYNERVFLQNPK